MWVSWCITIIMIIWVETVNILFRPMKPRIRSSSSLKFPNCNRIRRVDIATKTLGRRIVPLSAKCDPIGNVAS